MVLVCIMVNTLTDYNVTRSKVLEKKNIVMNIEHDYLKLLKDVLENGKEKEDRTGTGTISVFGRQIRHDMSRGFPLLTTKKMYWKGIVTELLWFLRGDTNIKFLVDNDCHIWDGDAYKNFQINCDESYGPYGVLLQSEFINKIKTDDEFANKWGDLGPVYGKQWRKWKTFRGSGDSIIKNRTDSVAYIDQIKNLIEQVKTNPDSRRLMVSAWNPAALDQMTLPPCHYGFQVYTRELSYNEKVHEARKRFGFELEDGTITFDINTKESVEFLQSSQRGISLMYNARSQDVPLGTPFNIASYALLLEIIGKMVNMVPDELIGNLGDTHIYKNQIGGVKEQLTREPYSLPKLEIGDNINFDGTIDDFVNSCLISDFKIIEYETHPTIKIPLSN
jgi:thymidylate synthase